VEQKCPQDAGGSADDLQRRLAALSGGGGGAQPPPAVAAKPAWMTATEAVAETADVVTPLPPVVPVVPVVPAETVAVAAPVREKYRALFNFDARTADELSFKIGDEIYLVDAAQAGEGSIAGRDGWIRGTTEDGSRSGLFPGNYVEKAEA